MTGHVYMMSNRPNGTLYIGVTSELAKRVAEHKLRKADGFTRRYNLTQVVWYERHPNIVLAIRREEALKRYQRQ